MAAGELEEGEVVVVLLGPADEDAAVAVEPGVGGLDDPSSGAPARVADLLGELLAARADVRLEALLDRELADLVIVVAAVEAPALRRLLGRDRAGDRRRPKRRLQQLHVVAVGTAVGDADRDARALGEDRTLRPLLALSVGFRPVAGPPSGALVIAPSAAENDQS